MLAQLAGAERRSAKLPLASVRRMVVATLGRALDDKEFDELLNEVV
jgi:Ca2+-binding EF-hand superfamily protein